MGVLSPESSARAVPQRDTAVLDAVFPAPTRESTLVLVPRSGPRDLTANQ